MDLDPRRPAPVPALAALGAGSASGARRGRRGVRVDAATSLLDLVGDAPPPRDEFDIRRVEFKPGEIKIRVTNPQRQKLTIATVTVDDAIVPFRVDGPKTLGRLRSSTIVVPSNWVEGDPYTVGVTSSSGIETHVRRPGRGRDARRVAARVPRLRADRVARRDRPRGARPRLAARRCRRAGAALARRVHGADRRAC